VTLTTEVTAVIEGDASLAPATTLPPTFLAPRAVVHAILDPNRGPAQYFGIWLDAGATLKTLVIADGGAPGLSITEAPMSWSEDPELEVWAELSGPRWVAPAAGLYLVRVADTIGRGSPYRYTLGVDAGVAPPLSSVPPEGTPITGTVELGGRVASEPPGTAVASGATVHGYLTLDRQAGYFAIGLELGDTLVTHAEGDVRLSIAYPSDQTAWYPLEGPWLASESGTYTVRVAALPLSGAVPFTIAVRVDR
jgi:hypothetical protein